MAPFKVGDITTTRSGRKARIICVDRASKAYPVVALIRSGGDDNTEFLTAHTLSGEYHESRNAHANDLMPVQRLEDLKVDAPILVRDSVNAPWKKRHFAKVIDGRAACWSYGATSWSVDSPDTDTTTTTWHFWKLP